MRALLDTHTFLWAMGQPAKLSKKALAAIRAPENDLFVSAATAWELSIKFQLGRLPEAASILARFDALAEALGAQALSMNVAHSVLAGALDWDHTDPFDRMLAAQALTENLSLVSRDRAFASLRGLKLLW